MQKTIFVSLIAALLCYIVLFTACKKMPNGGAPFYIQLDSPSVVINSTTEGSAFSKITDVWLEANSENRGAFEMPVKVPILQDGWVRFVMSPGIKDNGSNDARMIYPFLTIDTLTIPNATIGSVYHHKPVFHYKDGTKFWIDDFEGSSKFTGFSVATSSSELCEGSGSGRMSMLLDDTLIMAYQSVPIGINAGGREVYVELNYKTDLNLEVGFIGNTSSGPTINPLIVLKPKEEWNKTYLNFSYLVGVVSANSYQLYFRTAKSAGSMGNIYIDNVKILHF